jgi:U3 small nucleolar RNA-associated protein 5
LVATLGINLDLFFLIETVTALDRANAEDAILPLPKLHTQEKKRKHGVTKPSGDVEPEIHSDLTTTRSIHKRGK